MRSFFRKAKVILRCLWRVAFEYFAWILPYSRHPERYALSLRYQKVRRLVLFVISGLGLNVEAEGKELLLPEEGCLFIGNHVGASDPLLLIALSSKPISFVAKKEMKKTPIVGRVFRAIDGLFLDRDDAFQAVRLFREAAKSIQEQGLSYCIYPEGTRNKDPYSGHSGEFHPGSFKIAYMAKCPIITFLQFGTFHAFDDHKGKSHLIQFRALRRYEYADFSAMRSPVLSNQVKQGIDAVLPAMVDHDKKYVADAKTKTKPFLGGKISTDKTMRDSREIKKEEGLPGEGLFRTMAMALIIGGVIGFVAMFFPLQQSAPAGADASYYLPWCLPYGLVNLLMAGFGVYATTVSKEKPGLYQPGHIVGIVCGGLLAAEGLPIGIVFGNWEFCISMLVIGACIIAIAIVGIKALQESK